MSALKTAFKSETILTLFEISSRFKIHNDGPPSVFKSLKYIISSLKSVVLVKQVLAEFKINNGYVMPRNIIYYIPGNLLGENMV